MAPKRKSRNGRGDGIHEADAELAEVPGSDLSLSGGLQRGDRRNWVYTRQTPSDAESAVVPGSDLSLSSVSQRGLKVYMGKENEKE